MKTTTLNAIKAHSPCKEGWQKLLAHLGKTKADDEPLLFTTILEANGLDDALWCTRAAPQYDKDWRLFAARDAWDARDAARDAAGDAAWAAWAALAAGDAALAARDAARDAAWAAAREKQAQEFLKIVNN